MVLIWHYVVNNIDPTVDSLHHYILVPFRLTWTGVDMFFVLSGFLIGGILLDARDSSNYFQVFYVRRFFRIVPIYFAVLMIFPSLLFVARSLHHADYSWLTANSLPWYSFWTFTQNFWMAHNNNLGSNQLGVTWSLAIEEQFYLTLPFLVRFLSRRGLLIFVLAGIGLAPVLRGIILLSAPAQWAAPFVLMPCRADALLLGVLAAMVLRSEQGWEFIQNNQREFGTAMVVLLAGVVFLNWRVPFSGRWMQIFGYTWIALFYSAVLVLVLANRDSLLGRLAKNRTLAWLGMLAYCTYLIHQPIQGLLFALLLNKPPQYNGTFAILISVASLVATLLIARFSWQYFELPLIGVGRRFDYQRKVSPVSIR